MKRTLGAILAVGLLAVSANAAIIVDGNLSGADSYIVPANTLVDSDPAVSPAYPVGLDIDTLDFAVDGDSLYVLLLTKTPFSRQTTGTMFDEVTFTLLFSDDGQAADIGVVVENLDTPNATASVYDANGGLLMTVTELAGFVATDTGLEFRIPTAVLSAMPDVPQVYAKLDNGGEEPDDILTGQFTYIPEPATMSLLALGGLVALRRRRR